MSNKITTHLLPKISLTDTRIGNLPSIFHRLHLDWVTFILLVVISIIGLFMLYSASEQKQLLVTRQIVRVLIAFMVLFIFAQVDIRLVKKLAPWAYLVGMLLLLMTAVVGIEVNGAQRWIGISGLFVFQPSEIMKLVVPCTLVWFLTRQSLPPGLKEIAISLIIIALPCVLIAIQPDFGTALIIASTGFFSLFLAGLPYWFILSSIALVVISAPMIWNFLLLDYHKKRMVVFLNPESDPLGAGWNISQSITAIGSGGLEGKGWLNGTQSYLGFLPESHTDFIFSVIAEEHGFKGVVILLILYIMLIFRGLHIASQAQETYSRLIAGTLVMTLFVYVFINIGMVNALLPVVGVPLPFISYGGTSIVTLMVSFGILMSIKTHKRLLNR